MSLRTSTFLLGAGLAFAWPLAIPRTAWSQNSDSNFGLPTGVHPHLRNMVGEDPDEDQGLDSEIKNLGQQIKTTVRSVTAKRSFSCLGDPCNIKAFPLMYTKRYSGFWGGARAKLTNDSRLDPYLYAVDLNFQRSDTQQSEIGLSLDIPRLSMLAYEPRLKVEFVALKNNEVRYFGQGQSAAEYERHFDRLDETRFNLEQYQFEALLSFRIAVVHDQTYSVFGGFHSTSLNTGRFAKTTITQLYQDKPLAYRGGVGGAWTIGLISDSRDSEFLARTGWMIEGGVSIGGLPLGNYRFSRLFLNDRRFFTFKNSTIAHRLTFDVLSGEVPFWEYKRVAGIQPIADIASSDILRAYYRGRFHESFKLVESLEWRYHVGKIWFFGLRPDLIAVPVAVNVGRLGDSGAWSASTGSYFAFSNSFLAQLFAGYAPTGWDFALLFGVNI